MQQRLSIMALSRALKIDPFYGDDWRVQEMVMHLRRQLLQSPMSFRFIDISLEVKKGTLGKTSKGLSGVPRHVWQSELLHVWCGLARLDTYEPGSQTPTGWYCWDYESRYHPALEIDRDLFKGFLRKRKLPLPAFWFPEAPDNSQRWERLSGGCENVHWEELVLLGAIEDEIRVWEETSAATVTERIEKARQLDRLGKQRAAVWRWLTGAAPTVTTEKDGSNEADSYTADSTRDPAFVFEEAGDFWRIVYEGEQTPPLKNRIGLRYVGFLLANPHREIHVAELAHAVNAAPVNGHRILDQIRAHKPDAGGLSLVSTAKAEPLLDARAKREFRNRIRELKQELEEARRFNDLPRIAKLEQEKEFLQTELKKAVGLGGKDRSNGNTQERIRKAVTNRIRGTIKQLSKKHAPLGQHLTNAIRTGTFCSYCPEKDIPWKL